MIILKQDLLKHYLKNIETEIYILREETKNPDFNKNNELNNLKGYCKLYKELLQQI